jgi:hypothetical protein
VHGRKLLKRHKIFSILLLHRKAHIQREVDVEYATSSWCSDPRSDCRNHRDISDISDNASSTTTSSATASLKSFYTSILRDVKFESANSRLYCLQSSATFSIEPTVWMTGR